MLQPRINVLWGGAIVLLAAWMIWQATAWPFRSRLFPLAIGIPVLILALVQFGFALRDLRRGSAGGEVSPSGPTTWAPSLPQESTTGEVEQLQTVQAAARLVPVETLDITARQALTISGWLLTFLAGVWSLGFTIASTLLTVLFLRLAGREGWKLTLSMAVGVLILFVGVFDLALNVPLAAGVVWEGLGIETPGRYLLRLWRAVQVS